MKAYLFFHISNCTPMQPHPTPTLKACHNFSPACRFSLSRQLLLGEIKKSMDRTGYHNLEGLTQLILSSQSLKKVTQLLLSVSVFSFVFSHSTWYSLFLHFFKIHFSSFSSLVLSYTMDKNCIFLIFNGILVVLAKISGTSFSPSTSDHHDEQLFKKNGDDHEDAYGLQSTLEIDSLPAKETTDHETPENVAVEEKEEEEEEEEEEKEDEEDSNLIIEEEDDSNLIVECKEEEGQNGLLRGVGEEEGGGGGGGGELQSTVEDDEEYENELGTIGFVNEDYEEEEENRLLSTEELNKKFDDFIRRMKEEIRIGAQQQLVMAQ